jgi:hypothetical protein
MKNIQELVNQNMNKSAKAQAEEKVRFMLVLDEETRENLRTLCEELGVAQIGFASEIFTIALAEARASVKAAKATAKPSA